MEEESFPATCTIPHVGGASNARLPAGHAQTKTPSAGNMKNFICLYALSWSTRDRISGKINNPINASGPSIGMNLRNRSGSRT